MSLFEKFGGKTALSLVVFSFVVLVLFVSNLIVVLLVFKNMEDSTAFRETSTYQYVSVNKDDERTSVGFVEIFEDIEKNGYLSYENEEGYSLISNFGDQEFKCRGKCFCKNKEERRIASTVTRTSYFLLVAVSLNFAYSIAKDHFRKECENVMSNICYSDTAVLSEVESCDKLSPEEEKNEEKEEVFGDDEQDLRKFWCHGNCIPKKLRPQAQHLAEEYNYCEELEVEGILEVDCAFVKSKIYCNKYGRAQFQKLFLTSFCKENSREKYKYSSPNGQSRWSKINICVSGHGNNPTIRCKQIWHYGDDSQL